MGLHTTDGATAIERTSERRLVTTRHFRAPVALVYKAWTDPTLFSRWWAPASTGVPILSCIMDVREGGTYRLTFGTDPAQSMSFYGRYTEVVPQSRLVWTNEESGETTITTVTFRADQGGTHLVLTEDYPTKEALDDAFVGMEACAPEQFAQLDALLETLAVDG